MSIIIIGAGEVGYHLARRLSQEKQNVVIIDRDPEKIRRVQNTLDVQAIQGSGGSVGVLKQAGISEASMIIAVTNSDEANMISCLVAGVQDRVPKKIARVRDPDYSALFPLFDKEHLDIDYVINPDLEVAEMILKLVEVPEATELVDFADGQIRMIGFPPKNESVEFYRSPFIEYAITFYMFVAGANFSLHYRLLKGEPTALFPDPEFRFYLAVVLFSTFLIMLNLFGTGLYKSLLDCFRLAIFQVVSIQTTTGYTTADFEKWPAFSQYLLLLLMFIGGCAGSTGGAIKCVRILILLKHGMRELKQLIHPHAVIPIKLGGKILSPGTLRGVWALSFLYMLVFVLASLVVSLLGADLLTAVSAVATTLGNTGPGLAEVGPMDNFAHLPTASKWILTFCMLCGRLEIYTLLILFVPEFWRK